MSSSVWKAKWSSVTKGCRTPWTSTISLTSSPMISCWMISPLLSRFIAYTASSGAPTGRTWQTSPNSPCSTVPSTVKSLGCKTSATRLTLGSRSTRTLGMCSSGFAVESVSLDKAPSSDSAAASRIREVALFACSHRRCSSTSSSRSPVPASATTTIPGRPNKTKAIRSFAQHS
eukprot:scaffold367_cov254-Pinguiococcus_pyrenoidosus.AAC.15